MSEKLSVLAERIERFRRLAGLSQVALSQKAGLTSSAVNDIVQNPDRSPRLTTVKAIADALEIPITSIIGEDVRPDAPVAERPEQANLTVTPVDFLDTVLANLEQIQNLVGTEQPSRRLYLVRTEAAAAFGFKRGDVLVVDTLVRAESGQTVVVEFTDGNGRLDSAVRYYAEPFLFGFGDDGAPLHEYADATRVRICGPVVGKLRVDTGAPASQV